MSISGYAQPPFASYKTMQDNGELKLRITTSYTLDPEKDLAPQFAEVDKLKAEYDSDLSSLAPSSSLPTGLLKALLLILRAICPRGRKGC